MIPRKSLMWMAASVALAGIGGIAADQWLKGLQKKRIQGDPEGPVVVAKRFLKPGVRIEKKDVEVVRVPIPYRQPMAFETVDDLLGRDGTGRYVPRVGLLKGEHISRSHVVELAHESDLGPLMEPGLNALTLLLDPDAAGAGLFHPGDSVAVFAVWDALPGGTSARGDVLVEFAPIAAINGQTKSSSLKFLPNEPILVTLLLTPRDAGRVLAARMHGRVHLALRTSDDEIGSAISAVSP